MSYHVDPSKKVFVSKTDNFRIVHHVKIIGYSVMKDFGDSLIEAGIFDLAGHTWAVCYRPNVIDNDRSFKTECMVFSLVLVTRPEVPFVVSWKLSILSQDGKYPPKEIEPSKKLFNEEGHASCNNFIETYKIKGHEYYLQNDCLLVQCTLQVKRPSYTEDTKKRYGVVPSSDLIQHLGCLLEREEGADVVFCVNEETFVAHKVVLAARSPVFKAQFFGSMMESKANLIRIEEMKPQVFKAMLHFIYTDMLPPQEDVLFEMAQHLLVAADRYGLERLKTICAELLCTGVDANTAASTLALAVRHSCHPLKDFCINLVASRQVLETVMASDEFENLVSSCPWVVKDIIEKMKKVYV